MIPTILLILMIILSFQLTNVKSASNQPVNADALSWILTSKMIVENPSDAIYNQTHPPQGGVFFAYDIENQMLQQKIHIPSAAEYVKLTADLAAQGNTEVKNQLIMVADFLLTSISTFKLESATITAVAPIWLYKNGTGWYPETEELYTRDMLNVAYALLDAYQVTDNRAYLSNAKNLLDSTLTLQTLTKQQVQKGNLPQWAEGSLPWIVYNYNSSTNYSVTLRDLDLSLTDVGWEAMTTAYNIVGDTKYLECRDQYFNFIITAYQELGQNAHYPYQFVSDRGSGALDLNNYDSVNKEWGYESPFTSDLALHQIEGLLMNPNQTSIQTGIEFLQNLSLLQKNYQFDDSYYPTTGNPVGYGNSSIATAEYLFANKLAGTGINEEHVTQILNDLELHTTTTASNIYNGAWEWSSGSEIVESMATIVIIHDQLLTPSMIPQTKAANTQLPALLIVTVAVVAVAVLSVSAAFIKNRNRNAHQRKNPKA
jgi:hypothetical protein